MRVFQSCIYDYFKYIDNSKDPEYTRNSLYAEYDHISRRQLKKFLKGSKNETNNEEDSTRMRYVSKLIRVKNSEKGNKLRTEMTHDERIEKDFWKYCKENFESEYKVLPDFEETICYGNIIKSIKKNKCSRDYFPPSWMKILDEPNSPFELLPSSYREIGKIIHKMKSSGSTCPFDDVRIALKRCPILRSAIHHIIVYCWQNNIIAETWKRGFCELIYKKGSPKKPSSFKPITLEPVCTKVLKSLI